MLYKIERCVIFTLALLVISIFSGIFGLLFIRIGFTSINKFLEILLTNIFSIISVFCFLYILKKRSFKICLFLLKPRWICIKNFLLYFLFISFCFSLIICISYKFDIITFKDIININHSKVILYLAAAFMIGLNEEILFRGSIMMYIKHLINTKVALAVSSILFSLMHFHYNAIFPFITVALGGIILALLTFKYKSLFPAIGFHMGWDFSYFIFEDIFNVTKSIPHWGEIFEIPQIILLVIVSCILIYTCQKQIEQGNKNIIEQ